MRKSSPCSTSKQGPMRATLPVSSQLRQGRQGSSLRKSNSNSPTVSPTNANAWRARISPETSSSGQRSPGSLSYKGIYCFYVPSVYMRLHVVVLTLHTVIFRSTSLLCLSFYVFQTLRPNPRLWIDIFYPFVSFIRHRNTSTLKCLSYLRTVCVNFLICRLFVIVLLSFLLIANI